MARVVNWDGKNIPDELRNLPPGRYVLETLEAVTALSEAENDGLEKALDAMNSGEEGLSVEEVRASYSPRRKP